MPRCCQDAIRKACGGSGAGLREPTGGDGHVHPLAGDPPKACASGLVNSSLKGVAARRLRSQFTGRVNRRTRHGHLWSPSCPAASGSGAPLSIIRQYVEQQRTPVTATSGLTPP